MTEPLSPAETRGWPEALAAYHAKDFKRCLALLDPLLATYGPVPDWLQLRVRSHGSLGDLPAALADLAWGLEAQPRCGKLWEFAAAAWDAAGGWDVARRCLQRQRELGLASDEAGVLAARLAQRPAGGTPLPDSWRDLLERPAPPPTVGACLIVGDDYDLLPDCLRSLAGLDAIVVVDTAGHEATRTLVEEFGGRYAHQPWTGSFAAARNASLALATTDWLLVIDADERLGPGGVAALRRTIDDHGGGRVMLSPVIVNELGYGERHSRHRVGRVFARVPGRRYVGRIHEHVADEGAGPLAGCAVAGWEIRHLGYRLDLQERYGKARRNAELLQQWIREQPDDPVAWFYWGRDLLARRQANQAVEALEKALTLGLSGQMRGLAVVDLMQCLAAERRQEAVVRLGEAERSVAGDFPDYWLALGYAYRDLNRYGEARRCFEAAAGFAPGGTSVSETMAARTWRPRAALAEIAWLQGRAEEAFALSRALLGEAGVWPEVWAVYLRAALALGHRQEADQFLTWLLGRPAPERVYVQLLGVILREAGWPPEAVSRRLAAWDG